MTRRLLIVKTGSTLPEIARRRGDFEDWIAEGTGWPRRAVVVVDVAAGGTLPEPASVSATIVTGSSAMVSERVDWSERTAVWLRGAVSAGRPILGLCYGHQLLAHALGGRVGPNPLGREIGTVEVDFAPESADDPLLAGRPDRAPLHATHSEAVLALPPGAVRLASTALDPFHAFRAAPRAWGVQFHPEFDEDVMRGYLAGRREELLAEGIDPDARSAAVRPAPYGPACLRRFAELARER